MNYKPYVSWGIFGGTNATQRANYFASWGLFASFPTPPVGSGLGRIPTIPYIVTIPTM